MEPLPPRLRDLHRRAEQAAGQPIRIRGVRTDRPGFRGRLSPHPGYLLLEYQVAQAGYFWHLPTIEALLARAAEGCRQAVIEEAGGE